MRATNDTGDQLWKQLSRFQRYLFYVAAALLLVCWLLYQTWSHTELARQYTPTANPEAPHTSRDEPEVDDATVDRKAAVVRAFQHAWRGYRRYAWGHDHLRPISKDFHDWFGLGLTIVDAMDTLFIMGLSEELQEARTWVSKSLHFDIAKDVNLFETTIRVMGSLLSMFHLTKDSLYLDKARDLGERLLPGFSSNSGIPYSDVNLQSGTAHAPIWAPDSTVSEVSSIQLEFRALSRAAKNPVYEQKAFAVSEHLHKLPKRDGLVPMFVNADSGRFSTTSTLTLGARADSYYEYLLKQWIQTGKTIDWLKEDYLTAVEGIRSNLVRHSKPGGLLFVGELIRGQTFSPKMDHLVCYLPGTLALGYHHGLPRDHLDLAQSLMDTCLKTYAVNPTFLAPEISHFNMDEHGDKDIIVKSNDAHNLLRPETLESLWYLYYVTQNKTYQDWGWRIFQGFNKYCKVESGGYTSINNVRSALFPRPRDMMESFFLAETLKYLYLLFSDEATEAYSPDKFIYNTEAHLLPIYDS
ncbi:endoplasmic reticulum mannosyl-oligosaccharide 1,2-alpha-mannosidase-like isoform X2 [Ornithodoros turicata]|uniref:endoplasmic reticulum mannosyl-oligosaccharide 1,2-alpha-mannosidase-like isoform X2 n=1 Tax=Ornithodoros turicata TaxID=34597 RepID=UPI003139B8C0